MGLRMMAVALLVAGAAAFVPSLQAGGALGSSTAPHHSSSSSAAGRGGSPLQQRHRRAAAAVRIRVGARCQLRTNPGQPAEANYGRVGSCGGDAAAIAGAAEVA